MGVELDANRGLFAVEGAVDGLADLFSILLDEATRWRSPTRTTPPTIAGQYAGAHEVLLPAKAELGWLPWTSMRCLLRCGMA